MPPDIRPSKASPPPPEAKGEPAQADEGKGPVQRYQGFIIATIALGLCFSRPLYELIRFAAASGLYSYILLIPFISGYLIWYQKAKLPPPGARPRKLAVIFIVVALGLLALYGTVARPPAQLPREDQLAITTLSGLMFFFGVCSWFVGKNILRATSFPLAFLLFIVPFPTFLMDGIMHFLQYTSAAAAHAMLTLAGMPILKDGLDFRLPGITLQVAPECSGIHSTLVLFIVSLVAGHLFLRSPGKRAALALFVIPLAILRNGFRIFTIGELCVQIGPHMIHSYLHRRGGPIFFALSLIPFLYVLYRLRKSERAGKSDSNSTHPI